LSWQRAMNRRVSCSLVGDGRFQQPLKGDLIKRQLGGRHR
jgi:hypothetical protein